MKNLKISKKLSLTFGIIIVLFIITVVCAIMALSSISAQFTSFYKGAYTNEAYAMEIKTGVESISGNIGFASMSEDPEQIEQFVAEAEAKIAEMEDSLGYLLSNFSSDAETISNFKNIMDSSVDSLNQVFTLLRENKKSEAQDIYLNVILPKYEEAKACLDQLTADSKITAENAYTQSMSQKNLTMAAIVIIAIVTAAITLILALSMRKSFTHPILELQSAAKKLADGNLDINVTYRSRDELGSLAEDMRLMVVRLSSMIKDLKYLLEGMADGDFSLESKDAKMYSGEFLPLLESVREMEMDISKTLVRIDQASDQVASGAQQLSSGSQTLAQGATEQASSVEELASTLNEISTGIKETAENAARAHIQTDNAKTIVELCNSQMKDMIGAMQEISESSTQIEKIIKTIEDIAFQTNILALNAAVEAARAGAAGKGFAVVADEVQNLAAKSAAASQSTSHLVETSLRAVNKGQKIADETAASLSKVVASTQKVAEIVEMITKSTEEQSNATAQVVVGVDQISSVVQTNSATAEESAAASEELSSQSELLKQLVKKFRLNGNGWETPERLSDQRFDAAVPEKRLAARETADEPMFFDNSKY